MMRTSKRLKHVGITLAAILLLVVIPVLTHFSIFDAGDASDATSSASIALPDSPSGEFYVLVKDSFAKDDLIDDWKFFFTAGENDELPVLFDSIHCMTAVGDATAEQLAERYQAFLSPGQMTLTQENATMLVSKADNGYVEMAIFSKDMAEALGFSPEKEIDGITVLKVSEAE